MKLLAFDFETHLIADRPYLQHGSAKVLTGPYVTPRVVLGSLAGTHAAGEPFAVVEPPPRMRALLCSHLEAGGTVVGHHTCFDLDVLLAAFPEERALWYRALEEGRVLDTKLLDVLYRLSVGYYDAPDPKANFAVPELKVRTLAELAAAYCGATLNKDDAVRLNFGQYEGRLDDLPEAFRRYAAQDAIATLAVAKELLFRTGAPWDCAAQLRGEWALYQMDKRGMAIDRGEALRLRALFSRDIPALQAALVQHGLGRWEPIAGTRTAARHEGDAAMLAAEGPREWTLVDGTLTRVRRFKKHVVVDQASPEFHLNTAAIRERFEALAGDLELDDTELKRTDTGLLSVTYDEWADRVPPDRPDLVAWGQHAKLTKILSAYLNLYAQVDRVFPRWRGIGARSGRMSASSPAVQQIPKRRYGIRSVFVPSPGRVFVVADYATQEVFCLAEVLHSMNLDGPLIAALRSGDDLHTRTASQLLGKPAGEVTKADRQAAKAVVFGVPGGLGARRLAEYARKSYGLDWDLPEAKRMRERFLQAYPDIATYLTHLKTGLDGDLRRASGRGLAEWKHELGAHDAWDLRRIMRNHPDRGIRHVLYTAERSLTVTLPTGFVRRGCTFTEGANSYFQGLAAAVTKEAAWRAHRAGLALVAVVHDEILVEAAPEDAPLADHVLRACMLGAFADLCPWAGPHARVESKAGLARWGEATMAGGEAA